MPVSLTTFREYTVALGSSVNWMHFLPPVFTIINPFMNEIHLLAETLNTMISRSLVYGNLPKMIALR